MSNGLSDADRRYYELQDRIDAAMTADELRAIASEIVTLPDPDRADLGEQLEVRAGVMGVDLTV